MKKYLSVITFLSALSLGLTFCSSNNPVGPEPDPDPDPIVDPTYPVDEDPDGYADVMPSINDSNILQAFCWTYNQIKENIPAIAEAGFAVVQTSPVQQPKGGGNTWWAYYQPLSFSIADNSVLGTKQELKELCDVAEEYGVAVICDIVFNHMANVNDTTLEPDGTPVVSPEVALYEPEIYEHRNDSGETATFHHNKSAQGSGSVTQVYSYGHLPDLNTANPVVQQRCLDLLKECIDVGVDGFRFDAAKHIETPTDPNYPSDFWPNVLGVAKDYYHTKTNQELIAYGEILNDVDGGRNISAYTPYMKVTDNSYIGNIYNGIIGKDASKLLAAEYGKDTAPSNLVTWAESHDTYVDASSHIGEAKIAKEWAVISSRKDTVSMYLARPDSVPTVGKVNSYAFESPVVAAVNRFHNRFKTQNEHQSVSDGIYVNERYDNDTKGAVLVNPDTDTGDKRIVFNHMGTDVFYDQITGTEVVVRENIAHIDFPVSGVVVLTKSKNVARPHISSSHTGGLFAGSLDITITSSGATESYYTINGGEHINFTGSETITLGEVLDENNQITIVVHASNSQFSTERTYIFTKVSVIEGYFNILNLNSKYLTDYEFYIWYWKKGSNGKWSKEYTVQDGVVLIDFSELDADSFLFAVFDKGYEIPNVDAWDKMFKKQSVDISIADGFFDASSF